MFDASAKSDFPLLVKEDSLKEDYDLRTEAELVRRCKNATDKFIQMEATIEEADGNMRTKLLTKDVQRYRVRSEVFNLIFPKDNVYDLKAGITRSVCDGFWIFIKPLPIGEYTIYFKGKTLLVEPFTMKKMKNIAVYGACEKNIVKGLFSVEVLYEIKISNGISCRECT